MAYYARYEPDETGALQKVVYNCGVGFCLPYYGTEAPPGTLACDGSEISREAYSELFQVLGTKAGAGDGVSTFNLPDFRGDFIRCVGGNAAALGVEQGDAIREIQGQFWDLAFQFLLPVGSMWGSTSGAFFKQDVVNNAAWYVGQEYLTRMTQDDGIGFAASRVVPTAAENRPVNVALLWCIIYE